MQRTLTELFLAICVVALIILSVSNGRKIDALSEDLRMSSAADGGHRHLDIRKNSITSQLSQTKEPIVFVGDSITELALLPASICGSPVINAGIGGINVDGYLNIWREIFGDTRLRAVVLALGINNSGKTSNAPPPIDEKYGALLLLARKNSNSVVMAGLAPIESGPLNAYFDASLAIKNNAMIQELASVKKVPFIDLRAAMKQSGLTVDGVHLNKDGYELWMDTITKATESALVCG